MRPRATRRVGRIPLAAFMQAFRIYQEEFWDAMLASADGEAARVSAMDAAGTLIRYINLAAAEAADVYLEAERLLHAQGERVRRDLLEDLLAGRAPAPGPKLTAARDAGLVPGDDCILVAAQPVTPAAGRAPAALRRRRPVARARLGGRPADGRPPRGGRGRRRRRPPGRGAVEASRPRRSSSPARGSCWRSASARSRTASTGWPTPTARRSAALERVRASGGVVALPALSAFDCLALFGAETARRRIPPRCASS